MRLEPVLLGEGVDGKRKARWRAMNGAEELALFGCNFAAAVEWIAGMLDGGDEWIDGTQVRNLKLDDADRLFECLYRALFGERIELRHRCAECNESYELTLELDQLFPAKLSTERTAKFEERLPGGTT